MPTPPIHAETPGRGLFFLSGPVLMRFFLCNRMLFSPAPWETFVSGGCWGFVISAMRLVGAGLIVSSSLSPWFEDGASQPSGGSCHVHHGQRCSLLSTRGNDGRVVHVMG